jgi:hypothetical protein
MDGLHIDLWHNGKNILCDSGTYSYAGSIGRKLGLTAAHNTVQVDGREQMKKHGPFMVYDWTSARNVRFSGDSFSGTMVSRNGYEHTRTISKTESGYVVDDEINGNGGYCEFYLHTPCNVRILNNDI